MVIYLNEATTKKNNKKKESNIDECIKRDYDLIVKETNMVSQKVYKVFKDTCKESTKKEIDIFYKNNPSAPKVKDITHKDGNDYIINMKYSGALDRLIQLEYETAIRNGLRKSKLATMLGYSFYTDDDFNGIGIYF